MRNTMTKRQKEQLAVRVSLVEKLIVEKEAEFVTLALENFRAELSRTPEHKRMALCNRYLKHAYGKKVAVA
ncbi:MAG: hypothetical protein JNJ61_25730 [Anaerolineae bacterium]|nr:hypothetical protein [Anaerolineae bacterium]